MDGLHFWGGFALGGAIFSSNDLERFILIAVGVLLSITMMVEHERRKRARHTTP